MASLKRWLLLAALPACGALRDEGYRGEALITIAVHAPQMPVVSAVGLPAQIGIFFNPAGAANFSSFGALVEQSSEGLSVLIPGNFSWSLFEAPPADVMVTTAGGGQYALGLTLIYYDTNGDGRLDGDEQVAAGPADQAVLYAPEDLDAAESPTGLALPAGYHVVQTPIACTGSAPPLPPHDGDCDVPLGAGCSQDSDCGDGGVCLTTEPLPWPGGYCAIPQPPTAGCAPKNGWLDVDTMAASDGGPPDGGGMGPPPDGGGMGPPPDGGGMGPPPGGGPPDGGDMGPPPGGGPPDGGGMGLPDAGAPDGWWVLACTTDADCGRVSPYQCDVSHQACLPDAELTLEVATPILEQICDGAAGLPSGPPR